ncbi:MAG: class I SAM-dependent methyltransferase [Ghiorsea sp.]|nr:class I SAM-dependent methyltransferase [Ghiorsea sp.]
MPHNPIPCMICASSDSTLIVAKARLSGIEIYDLVRCPACQASFFSPMPTPDALNEHYSNDYTFYKGDNYKAQGKGAAFARKYLIPYKEQGKLLDIGCASGDFLAGVQQGSLWEVYGTDINPEVVASVQKKLGLDVRVGEIENIGFDAGFFDVIRVQDILEHVPQPLVFLKACRRIIADDGTFYLSVPNGLADAQNLVDYYAKYDSPAFSGAGHIYFLSFPSLKLLFKQAGFRIEKAYSYNFKKGLRSFSILPKSKHWKRDLTPPVWSKPQSQPQGTHAHQQKKRSAAYYDFQFMKDEMFKLPGVHAYAQDLSFVLKPL